MPNNTQIDYSPALTDAESLLLTGIESNIAESVWKVLQNPRICWAPWQDGNGRTIYVLTPWNQCSEVITHYNESEIRNLAAAAAVLTTVENDIAFGNRRQIPTEFFERRQPSSI